MNSEMISDLDDAPPIEVIDATDASERETFEVSDDAEPVRPRKIPRLSRKPRAASGEPVEPATPRASKPLAEMHVNEDRQVKEWLESISSAGPIRVKVERQSPKMWKGLNVGGNLARYDHPIDEDWLRDHHGGGDFYLTVQRPKTNGPGWVFAGGRVIHIAGDPRTDDVYRDKPNENAGPAAPTNAIVDKTFSVLERELVNARSQSSANGMDPTMIQAVMAPMQAQVSQLGAMLRDSQAQLAQTRQAVVPERDEFREKMLSAMIDGDSARLTSIRTQHESELRQLKQSAIDTEHRLRDAFERDKAMFAMSHERELNALRGAYDMKVTSQETVNTTGRALLEGEIRRLQADLSEAKAELASLRIKKDKSPLDMIRETNELKEMLGIDDSSKEKSTFEKVLEVAGNLPAVQGVITRLASGEGGAQPPPPPVVRRAPQLMTGPDGNLYRQGPDGTLQLVRKRSQIAPAPASTTDAPAIPQIAPATIKVSVEFLESAFRNGHEPVEVATSVRSMVPADVLEAIRSLGIDGFLANVAKIDASSPLSSQAGRNWARKLGKALVGDA